MNYNNKSQRYMNQNLIDDKNLNIENKKKYIQPILGWILFLIGIFAAIGIPIAITLPLSHKKQNVLSTPNEIEAISLLNAANNYDTRINIWNDYITDLSTPITPNGTDSKLNKIIREDIFIDQFIDFLTTNLLVDNSSSPEVGSITQQNLDKIKNELNQASSKEIFKNANFSVYTNLFNFSQNSSTAMFSFNNVSIPLISFSLFMPLSTSGLDLIYRDDKTVAIKIDNTSNIITNKIRLTINKFSNPSITTPVNYYFKSFIPIEFPSIITHDFPNFFSSIVNEEIKVRDNLINGLIAIKTSIDSDSTSQKGLSYWNDFTTKYGSFNKPFVEKDLQKTIDTGSLYTFISRNISPGFNPTNYLNQIKNIATNPANLDVNSTPYNVNSRTLFNTNNTSGDRFNLTINVYSFWYEFTVNNLFSGLDNAIKITPHIRISGSLIRRGSNSSEEIYIVRNNGTAPLDMTDTINMTYLNGLVGFFYNLIIQPIVQ